MCFVMNISQQKGKLMGNLCDEHSTYIYLQQRLWPVSFGSLLRFHIYSCFVQLVNLLQ